MQVLWIIEPHTGRFDPVCVGYVMLADPGVVAVSVESPYELVEDEELAGTLEFLGDDEGKYQAGLMPPLNPI